MHVSPTMLTSLLLALIILGLLAGASIGFYRTYRAEHSGNQTRFIQGHLPAAPPDGSYQGRVAGYNGVWQGKKFSASTQEGVNLIRSSDKLEEKYPFRTYDAPGIRDRKLMVIKIDYNLPTNPWWVRLILDEVIEVAPDTLLGKIHLQPLPGVVFTVGYFTLEKQD